LDTGPSPILRQFWSLPGFPIKAAPASPAIRQGDRLELATHALAQALAICPLPHTKQNHNCLRNAHYLTFFDQLAFAEGNTDIAL
jgi:hypothetical protein